MVSELMALGAPTRPLLVPLFALYNVLVFGLAAGVWASAEGRRTRLLTAVALAGYGVCSSAGLILAPMEARSVGLSSQTLLHIWTTALQGVCMALTLVCGAFTLGPRFRLYAFATLALALGFGALAGVEATRASMPWIGVTERVSIYAWMFWLAALGIALARVPGAPRVTRAAARSLTS